MGLDTAIDRVHHRGPVAQMRHSMSAPGPWHASLASPSAGINRDPPGGHARDCGPGLWCKPRGLRDRSWHRSGITPRPRSVPGVPATKRPAFAQPFHTLDAGALRAAKLHAAAIASRGSRGPSIAPHDPARRTLQQPQQPGPEPADGRRRRTAPARSVRTTTSRWSTRRSASTTATSICISSTDNGTFTGAGAGLSVTDPQIQWDAQSGHWLYAALGVAHRRQHAHLRLVQDAPTRAI